MPPSFSACESLPTLAPVSAHDISIFCRTKYNPVSDAKRANDIADAAPAQPALPSAPSLSVYPNPMQSLATVSVGLPEDIEAKVVVRDVTGRVVATVWAPGIASSGLHTLRLDTQALLPGVYALSLETAQYQKVIKLSVIK